MYYDEEQERREDKRNKILRTPINDFELSVRSRNCLANMNIRTLGDLVKKTEAELLSYKNFGETSLTEIKEILRNKSLRLGMNQEELLSKEIGPQAAEQVPLEEVPDPNSPDPAKRPVTELDLSVRCRRIVDILKIKTIGDLSNKSEAELLACPNFGQDLVERDPYQAGRAWSRATQLDQAQGARCTTTCAARSSRCTRHGW